MWSLLFKDGLFVVRLFVCSFTTACVLCVSNMSFNAC